MSSLEYEFQSQKEIGAAAERMLDKHFSKWFEITPASETEQRQGIDRWFVRKETSREGVRGERFAVEYKADHTAIRTGNVFVETISVERPPHTKLEGWARTSRSRWLVYLCVGDGEVAYLYSFAVLRSRLETWKHRYREKIVHNHDYNSRGICVPLQEFERYAKTIILLEPNIA